MGLCRMSWKRSSLMWHEENKQGGNTSSAWRLSEVTHCTHKRDQLSPDTARICVLLLRRINVTHTHTHTHTHTGVCVKQFWVE